MNMTDPGILMGNTLMMSNIDYELMPFKEFPIAIKVENWQASTIGSYIEFKIKCIYQEGNTPETWYIYKRYSDFSLLHE